MKIMRIAGVATLLAIIVMILALKGRVANPKMIDVKPGGAA
jgi:hypothetical protein